MLPSHFMSPFSLQVMTPSSRDSINIPLGVGRQRNIHLFINLPNDEKGLCCYPFPFKFPVSLSLCPIDERFYQFETETIQFIFNIASLPIMFCLARVQKLSSANLYPFIPAKMTIKQNSLSMVRLFRI